MDTKYFPTGGSSNIIGQIELNSNMQFKYKELEPMSMEKFIDSFILDEIHRVEADHNTGFAHMHEEFTNNIEVFKRENVLQFNNLSTEILIYKRNIATLMQLNSKNMLDSFLVKIKENESKYDTKLKNINQYYSKCFTGVYILGVVTSVVISSIINYFF